MGWNAPAAKRVAVTRANVSVSVPLRRNVADVFFAPAFLALTGTI